MSSLFDPAPAASSWPRYQHVIFDCDSTLSAVEGIDLLAAEPDTREQVVALTNAAMNGSVNLDQVYQQRLALIAPTRRAVQALAAEYERHMVDGARAVVTALLETGTEVYIVSGGLLEPVKSFGIALGVPASHIRAVELTYDELGGQWWRNDTEEPEQQSYLTYRHSALAESHGKELIIRQLLEGKAGASLLVGDGISDLLARNAVDLFVGYGGVIARPRICNESPVYLPSASLLPLLALALGDRAFYKLDAELRRAVIDVLKSEPPQFNRKVLQRHFSGSFLS